MVAQRVHFRRVVKNNVHLLSKQVGFKRKILEEINHEEEKKNKTGSILGLTGIKMVIKLQFFSTVNEGYGWEGNWNQTLLL